MNKPIALLDLDDTLIDTKEALYQLLLIHFGNRVPHWTKWVGHHIEDTLGITSKELTNLICEDETFRRIKPIPSANAFLKELKRRDYHVLILTAREGFMPDAYEETEKYINKFGFYYDELIVSQHGVNKMEYLDHHDNIKFAIDDQEPNCIHLRKSDKVEHVFMHALPQNSTCANFVRVANLNDVFDHMECEVTPPLQAQISMT